MDNFPPHHFLGSILTDAFVKTGQTDRKKPQGYDFSPLDPDGHPRATRTDEYHSKPIGKYLAPGFNDSLKRAVYDTLIANSLRKAYVRLTVSRGYGPIGLDPDLCPEPTVVIITQERKDYPRSFYENGIGLIIPETKRNFKEAINPRIKSLNFLNNVLAKIEAKRKGAYDAVMLNVYEKLTEGTISNVFFYKDGILCTPSLECGILDGITRGIVITIAKRDSLKGEEGQFTKEDLYSAKEVFVTNSTMEVMPVSRVDDQKYTAGNITKLLHKTYRDEINAYVANLKAEGPSLWGYE